MNLLKELYTTNAKSGKEDKVSAIVQRELTDMGLSFEIDVLGQIYRINEDNPLLCAHMDQVQSNSPELVIYDRGEIFGVNEKGKNRGLGADDKNGIWIILKLLKQFPECSFIFSTEEETGGNIQHILKEEQPESRFCLVFDRKGSDDIIATYNAYCEDDLIDDLLSVAEDNDMMFEECMGIFSDCDHINKYIPCVNISCGYHDAHTEHEYTVLSEIRNSLKFGKLILTELWDTMYSRPPVHIFDTLEDIQTKNYTRSKAKDFISPSASSWYKEYYTGKYKSSNNIIETNRTSNDIYDYKKSPKEKGYVEDIAGDYITCYDCGQEYHITDMDEKDTCPFCGALEYIVNYDTTPTVKG